MVIQTHKNQLTTKAQQYLHPLLLLLLSGTMPITTRALK